MLKSRSHILTPDLCAVLLRYRWCRICHKTWSQWFLSVSPLNLTVKEQEGFKRELMNWPFAFHLFLISIRTQLTFSATYQVSGPPRLFLQPNTNIALQNYLPHVLSSALISFISLAATAKEELHKQTMTCRFPRGTKAVYQRTDFSPPGCRMWECLFGLFAVLRCSDKGCDRRLSSRVRAQKQQETNYRSKQNLGGHYTHSPSFLFFISITSLIHWDKSNFALGKSHFGGRGWHQHGVIPE